MRLIRSALALKAAVALSATAELTLTELARAAHSTPSAMQRALEILRDDRIVRPGEKRGSAYRLAVSDRAGHVAALAVDALPIDALLAIAARANPALEFVAQADGALVVVFAGPSTALDQARAARFIDALAARHGLAVEYLDHDDVRRRLLSEPELRARMARARILSGRLDRSFPDRSRHGLGVGTPLHRPHRSVHPPSPSTLRRIARRHGVRDLKLFGSAVRTDFRPDSDVDVLLRFRDGVRPTLRALIDLEAALEAAFGRDVDLVREELLGQGARARIDREAVALW